MLSVLLAIISASLTHICVRHAHGTARRVLFVLAMLALGAAFYWGDALGGFWPGFYTLLSVYFLACITTPWIDLFLRRRRAA